MSAMRTGIVGAGNMGGRMGRRVLAAGDPIVAFDSNSATLAGCGIPAAVSTGALTEAVDVVLLSLPDSSVIEDVVLGDDGVLHNAREGQVVVDLSTADPASSVQIHDALHQRGIAFLDAGISGGAKAADAGTLTLMVGGDEAALAPGQTGPRSLLEHDRAHGRSGQRARHEGPQQLPQRRRRCPRPRR